jgi:hypothetical protein
MAHTTIDRTPRAVTKMVVDTSMLPTRNHGSSELPNLRIEYMTTTTLPA